MAKKEQVSEEKQAKQQQYNEYVKQVTPTRSLPLQMLKAFITGGLICTLGQFILNICEKNGLDKDTSGGWCSMILILLSIVLTGLNIYPSIAKWGGACADYGICKFCGCSGDRVSERRTGLRNRM